MSNPKLLCSRLIDHDTSLKRLSPVQRGEILKTLATYGNARVFCSMLNNRHVRLTDVLPEQREDIAKAVIRKAGGMEPGCRKFVAENLYSVFALEGEAATRIINKLREEWVENVEPKKECGASRRDYQVFHSALLINAHDGCLLMEAKHEQMANMTGQERLDLANELLQEENGIHARFIANNFYRIFYFDKLEPGAEEVKDGVQTLKKTLEGKGIKIPPVPDRDALAVVVGDGFATYVVEVKK